MRINLLTILLFGWICMICCLSVQSQAPQKKYSEKYREYTDSLKRTPYPFVFPILGAKAARLGFDVPYPIGVMTNYFFARQSIVIDNIQLGFKGPNNELPLTDFSHVIKFGNNTATVSNFNVRPDVWILPFLDIYGIFGYTPSSSTSITLTEPFPLSSSVNQSGSIVGFGLTGAFGLGPLWTAIDFNWTWNQLQLIEKPVQSKAFGLRLGHPFLFPSKPYRNFSVWVGAMRVRIESITQGEVLLDDVIPDASEEDIANIQDRYSQWYNGLSVAQKKIVDQISEAVQDKLEGHPLRNTYVSYSLEKRPAQEWSGLVGAQFQLNKHWIFRTEWNFIGDRFSALGSVNYRFGIRRGK
jgi:hypothetical protein